MLSLAAVLGLAAPSTLKAATMQAGDVTTTLGPTFFVDDTASGGTDTDINHGATVSYPRFFNGLLAPNQGPTRIALTGFGFYTHTSATSNDATNISLTFTYLGADQAVGGGDDILIGTVSAGFVFGGGVEHSLAFDTPLTADLNITGTKFLIQLTPTIAGYSGPANLALKLKTASLISEPAVNSVKLSVAGFASSLISPGRVNLAKFQPVTTSSVNGQRLATYVTDGHTGNDNRWQSNGTGPHWAEVDLPFPVEIGSAQVFTGVDDTSAQANFRIQYLSGTSWVDAPGAVVTGNTDVERNIVFTSSVTSSSFRVYSTDGTLRIRELGLYAPNGISGFALGTDLTTNLAYQRPAVASASTSGNVALNAVDGRASAFIWQTNTAGTNTLDIDLRVSTKIGSAHLYSGSNNISPLANFALKYWDGSAWQNISGGTVAGNSTSDLVIPFTAPVTTSKVRLEFTNPGTASVRELCIFPANTGNIGYPIGTNIIGSGAFTKYDDYSDSFYQITNPSSSRFIAVAGGAQPALDQAGLTTAQGQYQVLLNLSTGTYRLRNRSTGYCLSGAQLSKTAGDLLIDAPYTAMPHQDWILDPLGGGVFQLINQWSGLALDIQSGGTAAGTPLVQNIHTGASSQRWQFLHSENFPKKGVGGANFANPFNANWVYNWGLQNSVSRPPGSVYNPMQWGNFHWNWDATNNGNPANSTWKLYPAFRTSSQSIHLMGFNEPDVFSQSGNSLDMENTSEADFSITRSREQALELWPRLMAMDQPLVSPAPANKDNGWLGGFYSSVNSLGYRVDYTALHTYPGPSGGSSDSLVNTVQSAYTTWDRPVWLTEFSFVDWDKNSSWTEEDCYNTLAEFLWRAESLSWFRKYALFVFTEDANNPMPANPWSTTVSTGGAPRSNARDINGNLTAFGKLYAAWDNDAVVRSDKSYYIHNKSTRKRMASVTSQSNPGGRHIRIDGNLVKWTLVAAPTNGRYYVVSSLDGRRLSSDGTTASLVASGTIGNAVEWSLTEKQHGWYYLNPATSTNRLRMAYNNSTLTATYSMVANTTTTDDVQWRFIVPPPPPVWAGSVDANWSTADNWLPDVVPATGDPVSFTSASTENLSTVLDQNFSLSGISLSNPPGPVSISGANTLTIGGGGLDLAAATQNLTITTPLVLSSTQSWSVAAGRTLSVDGGVSGAFALNIGGTGGVSLGAAVDPLVPITVASGSTLKMNASGVLASGATAVNPALSGTLDLNGTSQSINTLTGSGIIDNTAVGTAQLTVGNNNTAVTFNALIQDTGGDLTLVKTGNGILTLPSANTFSGGLTNNGSGNIVPQNNNCFGTGQVVMNSGTMYPITLRTFANALTLNGGILRIGGGAGKSITWTGPVTVTGTSTLSADGTTDGITLSGGVEIQEGVTLNSAPNATTNTISAPITGTGTVMTTGFSNGVLALSAANPFSGTYRAGLGTLSVGHNLALQNGTLDMHAADTGTVNLNNRSATIGGLTGSRNLALGSGTVSIGNNNTSTGYSGVLSGTGSLVKTGSGTLTLSGTNSYTGTTSVNAGTLALAASNVLPNTALSMGSATLDAATFTDTVGALSLTGSATINLGSGAALAFANSSAASWTGGSLNITGNFISGTSLRFGTTSGGLAPGQLALISVNGSGAGTYSLNSSGYLVAVTGAPEIAIEQPAATDIPNGGSKGYGTVTLGSNTSLTFTIRNTGTANLTLTGSPLVSVSGTNAADFTVTAQPASSVAASENTIFTVQFSPSAAGARIAVLTILNNDSDEGIYTININGSGQTQYDTWSGGAAFDADANGDGVKNGLAFLLGAANPNASALSLLPTVTQSSGNLTMTFSYRNAASRGGAFLMIQYSSDAGMTDAWQEVMVSDQAGVSGPVNGVTFNVTSGEPANNVQAEISSSEAVSGKLFGRLKAVSP